MYEKLLSINGNAGKQIASVVHVPNKKNFPVIIMCHAFTGNKLGSPSEFFKTMARKFSKKGFAVVRFDFTGSGDSEGEFEEQNLLSEYKDLKKVIDYVEKHLSKDIILLGHSRGGFVVIWIASEDKRVKAVISISAPAKMELLWGKTMINEIIKKSQKFDKLFGFRYTKRLVKTDLKHGDITDKIKNLRVPLLLIHQKDDKWVPLKHAQIIFENVECPKEKLIIPGGDHIFADHIQVNFISEKIIDWLNKLN